MDLLDGGWVVCASSSFSRRRAIRISAATTSSIEMVIDMMAIMSAAESFVEGDPHASLRGAPQRSSLPAWVRKRQFELISIAYSMNESERCSCDVFSRLKHESFTESFEGSHLNENDLDF